MSIVRGYRELLFKGVTAKLCAAAFLGVAVSLVPAAAAQATIAFEPDSLSQTFSNVQAGGHPDLRLDFHLESEPSGRATGDLRDLEVDLPTGLVGAANSTPTCPMARVASDVVNLCPTDTVVGYAVATVRDGIGENVVPSFVYNIAPYADEPAAFAMFPGFPARIDTSVGPERGYRVHTVVSDITEVSPLSEVHLVLWGVPADHNGTWIGGPEPLGDTNGRVIGDPGNGKRIPLLYNPTKCDGQSLRTDFGLSSWARPDSPVSSSTATALNPAVTGCDRLAFEPTVQVQPASRAAAAPSGYSVDVSIPQNTDPDGLGSAHLDDATVVFPEGVTLSPSVANGLGACGDAQFGIRSDSAVTCPSSAKIGSLSVSTPLLDGDLGGDVFVGEPLPGNKYRVFFDVGDRGIKIKLAGRVSLDPVTGQLTATFLDNPELPFSNLHVELKGGPNAALRNPTTCGSKTVASTLSSSSGQSVSRSTTFTIDQNCNTRGFAPKLNAGTASPIAGRPSPFTLQVTREDGEQDLARIQATLPEGVLAKLAGVPLCGEAQAPNGACPAASQVGTTTVGAGAGSDPLYVPQPGKVPTAVYLAGPYKSAPYSLVVKVPAQAGPFDLGNVVVRNALNVDPVTTQVTATSDPLPQILEGIPLSYRDVRVEVSRPDFTLNPTSCDPMSVNSTITSIAGKSANPSSRFQVTNCAALGFAPQLSLKVSGGTKRHSFPSLRAVLTQPKGQANIAKVAVTLPHSEFLEQAHIATVCTRVQFAADACPKASIYGKATAITPLLDKPLSGPVYLRSSNHPLPDLVASLHGAIDVDLSGRIDSVNGGIRASFETVPDAPVSKFVLSMKGGKKGLLVNSRNLCAAANRAKVLIDAQNGKTADQGPVVRNSCGSKGKKKARRH